MVTRRNFLRGAAFAGLSLAALAARGPERARAAAPFATAAPVAVRRLPARRARARAARPLPASVLNPTAIPKYQHPLLIPPAMPRHSEIGLPGAKTADYYEIAVRQFEQQVLPSPLPKTTVWGYGAVDDPGTFSYPAFTIEATSGRPVRVKWINDLRDPQTGNYLPHLLPVDQTLQWANPPGPRDTHGMAPEPYRGPVPLVTHVHGSHTTDDSDGFTEAWYLPAANDLPAGSFQSGTWYETFRNQFFRKWGVAWEPGTSVFQYPNDQRPATLWYHDHTLGMTRLNVYAGPTGFYLLRGGPREVPAGALPGPAPHPGDPPGTKYYEIPIVIQDRMFNEDGSLFYPSNRAYFEALEPEQLQIPYHPDPACGGESDIAPVWNPKFFGNTMVVNGRAWPYLEVEARRYRFRLLNGCNSRFLILRLDSPGPDLYPGFWVIGTEGGYLQQPLFQTELLMAPAERYDVIVDFAALPVGTRLLLRNIGPDEPYGGGDPEVDFTPADPNTTGQVLEFRVVAAAAPDTTTPPERLALPGLLNQPGNPALPASSATRRVSLNEAESSTVRVAEANGLVTLDCERGEPFGPREAQLGTVDAHGNPSALGWDDPVTENPALGATEVWEIWNYTADAHPIHIHQVMFEVLNREIYDPAVGKPGTVRQPEPWERAPKDTVISYPGQITRVKAKFDVPGLFAWHCHIVEHEDNEMMRPYVVGPLPKTHHIFLPRFTR